MLQLNAICQLVFQTHFPIIKTIKSKSKAFIKILSMFWNKTLKFEILLFNFQISLHYSNSSLKQYFQPFKQGKQFYKSGNQFLNLNSKFRFFLNKIQNIHFNFCKIPKHN